MDRFFTPPWTHPLDNTKTIIIIKINSAKKTRGLFSNVFNISPLQNVIRKVQASERIIHFKHAFVLGLYFMLRDKCLWFYYFVSNKNINLFRNSHVQLTYRLHSRRKLMALQRKWWGGRWAAHTCVITLHFRFSTAAPQLNSALPQDFTDIFQGLAFKPCLD